MFQAAVLSAPSVPQPFTLQQFYLHRLHHNPSHYSSSICTVCTTTLHTTAVLSAPSAPQPFKPQQFYLHRLHHNTSHHSSISAPSAPQPFKPQQFYLHRLHHNPSPPAEHNVILIAVSTSSMKA
jgi:hypothetical protein